MSEAGGTAPAPGAAEGGEGQAEGQGGAPFEGQGLYDLAEVPQELHQFLIPELKKIEGNVGRKLQEAADFRKQYEPLQGVEGLSDMDPELLQNLVEFGTQTVSDPEQFKAWYQSAAEQMAEDDPEGFEELWSSIGDKLGFFQGDDDDPDDPDGDVPQGLTPEDVKAMIDEAVQPFQQKETERERNDRVSARESQITEQLGKLDFGEMPGESDQEKQEALAEAHKDVMKLALAYSDEDPDKQIELGFADYQRLIGRGESGLVSSKLDQPGRALNGGRPGSERPEITAANVKDFAKARFANGVGAGT